MENKGVNTKRLLVVFGLILIAVATRFAEWLPDNVAAVTAVALFAGAYLNNNKMALIVPLVIMFLSDLAIGLHWGIPFSYGAFAIIGLVGLKLAKRKGVLPVIGASLLSSVIFFLISNFGTWAQGYYPMTFEGLMECYAAGIPFYRNTLVGDLSFTAVLFGAFYALQVYLPQLRAEKA